ncbi:ABC transporter ATP-binding protein [Staphylococcus chromogenes]|nr:ABC transporter ATP-binding protein [Staphylococcus chromogenes]
MSLLSIDDLAVSYHTSRGLRPAVSGVSLSVARGQMTAIVGESGSGKSTTALAALGLLPKNAVVTSGTVLLDGKPLDKSMRGIRVGLIPQDPKNSLNPVKSIGESVREGLRIHQRPHSKEIVVKHLESVGIDDPARRYHQYPHELSGGMNQRVLIAAALALEPDLLIADEPTSALDVTVQKTVLDLLDSLRQSHDLGVLFITHDLAVAADRADRVVVMERGHIRESGPAVGLLTDPQHPYTQRLIANAPALVADPQLRARPNATSEAILEVRDFSQSFGNRRVVEGVSFTVQRGATHAIVGESGSGKTTTGRAIAGFSTPASGQLLLEGKPYPKGRELHKRVQMVYQNPYSSLNPRQSVGDAIAEGARNFFGLNKSAARARAAQYLDMVSLPAEFATRRPGELSGGQRQRVAIARSLIVEPEIVVLDEAISALDVTVQAQILSLLDELQRELGLTYVFISHDLSVVREFSDTVSVLSAGRSVESGPTAEVFAHPQSEFTKQLIDAIPGAAYRAGAFNLGL